MALTPFHPTAGSTKSIAASAVSSNVNLVVGGASPGPIQVRVTNSGTATVFIRQGADNAVTASTTVDMPVLPGAIEVISLNVPLSTNGGLWVAAITASDTATIYLTPGAGI